MHIGLLSHYTDGMIYQDNCLAEENAKNGHDVTFITDIYKYENGKLIKAKEEDTVLDSGVRLIRIKYDFIINEFITNKIQRVRKLRALLEDIKPDSIMYHGVCGYELMDVADYVKKHSNVLFYVDSHEDFNNTARTIIAKWAYKYIHGIFVSKSRKYIKKVLYISLETRKYLEDMYAFSDQELEFYPLGGVVQNDICRNEARQWLIHQYNLKDDAIICAHSGKLDSFKKTDELLRAFSRIEDERLAMIIFGAISDEQKKILEPLIEADVRVHFVGWKSGKESINILRGVDLYCQPGGQSVTAQTALCCGCAEMLYPHPSYKKFFGDIALYIKNEQELEEKLNVICSDNNLLDHLKRQSVNFANKHLSYKKMAERYLK